MFVSVALPRKDRPQSGGQVPSSLRPSPEMNASPMVQLLQEENFALLFELLDVLIRAEASQPSIKSNEQTPLKTKSSLSGVAETRESTYRAREIPPGDLVHSVWELIMILPTNQDLKRKLELLNFDRDDNNQLNWATVMNPDKKFQLQYVLQVIDSLSTRLQDVLRNSLQEEGSSDSDSSNSENEQSVNIEPVESLNWVRNYIQGGGLKYLRDLMLSNSLAVDSDQDDWTLSCVGHILKLLTRFGSVGLNAEERTEEVAVQSGVKRKKIEKRPKKHVFRARFKSLESDNVVVIQGFNGVSQTEFVF